jgi:aurora kinase A-interacting protein
LSFNPFLFRQNTQVNNNIGIQCPLWRKKEIFEIPLTNKIIESPQKINKVIEDVIDENKTAILPDNTKSEDDTGKQAKNHMILIRRIKMNKHKLKKLRKKMKYEWAKVSC